jgi:hypothetical protein
MNEKEALQHLLDTLIKDYDRYQRILETLDPSDKKYVPIANTVNRYARTIAATISLMRDPRRQIMSDHRDKTKLAVSELAKEIIEEEQKARLGNLPSNSKKTTLITFKDKYGNRIIPLPEKMLLSALKRSSYFGNSRKQIKKGEKRKR